MSAPNRSMMALGVMALLLGTLVPSGAVGTTEALANCDLNYSETGRILLADPLAEEVSASEIAYFFVTHPNAQVGDQFVNGLDAYVFDVGCDASGDYAFTVDNTVGPYKVVLQFYDVTLTPTKAQETYVGDGGSSGNNEKCWSDQFGPDTRYVVAKLVEGPLVSGIRGSAPFTPYAGMVNLEFGPC